MKIYLCCPTPLTKSLGGSKVYLEIYEALQRIGAQCEIFGPDDISMSEKFGHQTIYEKFDRYPIVLKEFLEKKAHEFDVVEYEHNLFPFSREETLPDNLRVARSVLLQLHLPYYPFPQFKGIKRTISSLIFGHKRKQNEDRNLDFARKTCKGADLINVPNNHDLQRLVSEGISKENVLVSPYGLTEERAKFLAQTKCGNLEKPVISFVGTFDERKGAVEFPKIVKHVIKKIPNATFRLLGTSGQFKTSSQVLEKFPEQLHKHLEIHPTFDPEKITEHLEGSTIGLFPSHLESFGFGVLEMMAAGIPVVAYDVPGPPIMLRNDMLSPRGDWRDLADKIILWLKNPASYEEAQEWSLNQAQLFRWDKFATETMQRYDKTYHQQIKSRPE